VNPIERLHGAYFGARRLRSLCEHLGRLIPPESTLLDVGCGDGELSACIEKQRDDIQISGLDTLVRPNASIPVQPFDGETIPHDDDSFDSVLFADVLHHSTDPRRLLAEGARVARRRLLVKDHTLQGPASEHVLRFMDDVGNRRFGVALPYDYWTEERWREVFEALDLSVETWISKLHLYPIPLDWVFGRSLHFIASLAIAEPQGPR
jgi:SAM-dependent methyltransferase